MILSIPKQVRYIPLQENPEGLFMAGESLEQVWHDFSHLKAFHPGDPRAVLHVYGTGCPAQGCHMCTDPDCTYADFIRHYWNHPRCD
jgi:hypothetical protein